MNHNAMEAIMSDARPDTSPEQPAPARVIRKRWIATLMMGAALFGALISGLIHKAAGTHGTVTDIVDAVEGEPRIDVFFFGVGRYRK